MPSSQVHSDKMKSSMNATAVRSKWVGRVIDGRFTLLEWLGGSARSAVYVTQLPGDPTQKATIKLIPADDEGEARVADWAAAADLSHPHLIRPLHVGRCKIDGSHSSMRSRNMPMKSWQRSSRPRAHTRRSERNAQPGY